jgi:hypothetical protein
MTLPRLLLIDDVLGWSRMLRRDACHSLGLQDEEDQTQASPASPVMARAVFHPGQRLDGRRTVNDLPGIIAAVEEGWGPSVAAEQRWALILLDLSFSFGAFEGERPDPERPRSWPKETDSRFGLAALKAIADTWPEVGHPGRTEIPVVVVSSRPRSDMEAELNERGSLGYLERERRSADGSVEIVPSQELRQQLGQLLYFHGLFPDTVSGLMLPDGTAELRPQEPPILGTSLCLLQALRRARQAAATDAPCLVVGEPGVGKELFCRLIHEGSRRAARPLVGLNCANLSEGLLENELFGHVRGAFTGATPSHAGRFEQADGGTIFLDEIAELPLASQAKVLRALESGEVHRLGEDRVRSVDVRVIAATNKQLRREVAAGRFRADLLSRLEGLIIEVPPLRERPEDVAALFERFLALETRKQGGTPKRRVAPEVHERLKRYNWPGNVRELQRVAQRIATARRFSAEITGGDVHFESEGLETMTALSRSHVDQEPLGIDEMLAELDRVRIPSTPRELKGLLARTLDGLGLVVMRLLEAGLEATRNQVGGSAKVSAFGDLSPTATMKLLLNKPRLTTSGRADAQKAKDEFKRLARLFPDQATPSSDLSRVVSKSAKSRGGRHSSSTPHPKRISSS